MRFVIFGAGAVGSTVGAHFSKAGTAVLLIGDPPHVEKIQADGLKMSGKYGEFVTAPPACSTLDEWQFRADDVIFLCVKTYDSPVAIEQLRAKVPPETPIFCLQNTMTNEELCGRALSPCLWCGSASGCTLCLSRRGWPPRRQFASDWPLSPPVLTRQRNGLWPRCKPPTMGGALTDDILACKWGQVLYQSDERARPRFSTAPGPELLNDPDSRLFMGDLLEEAQQVLTQTEIKLKTLPGDRPLPDMVTALQRTDFTPKQLPARSTHVFPSMWQDVFCRRARTEARYLNGRVREMGQQLGIATPHQCPPHPGGRHNGGATGTARDVHTV